MNSLMELLKEFGVPAIVSGFCSGIFYLYYKDKLAKAAKIYEIKHSRLHEKRALAIEETYSSLVLTLQSLMAYLAAPNTSSQGVGMDRRTSVVENFNNFQRSYSQKRIFLPLQLCEKLVSIDYRMSTELSMIDFLSNGEFQNNISEKITVFTNLKDLINSALRDLENQMRLELSGE